MKKIIVVMLLLGLFGGQALASETVEAEENKILNNVEVSQQFLELQQAEFSYQQRLNEYEDTKKNIYLAPALSLAIPTAGHYYSEDWQRGLNFALAQLGGVFLASVGVDSGSSDLVELGALVTSGAKLAEVVDSYERARQFNEGLKQDLMIVPNLNEDEIGATLNYQF